MKKLLLTSESAVLALLTVAILWKGGKALDVVWLQALIAGAVTLFSLTGREEASPVPRLFGVALTLFTVSALLSFVFSLTRNYGFDEVLQTVSLALLAVWGAAESLRNPSFPIRFSKIVSGATLIACGTGIIVYVLQPVSRFSGTFFDYRFHTDYWPNAWAEFLLLAWPVLLWTLFLRPVRRMPDALNRDWIKSAVLGVVFGCLFLSFSRGGFLAFLGQTVLLALFVFATSRFTLSLRRIVACVLITGVSSVLIFIASNAVRAQFHPVESIERKVTFSSDEGASSISEREQFWRQAAQLARMRPLTGFGPYSFRFVQPHLQEEILATSDHPHNVFLKLASERGVAAAVLFAALLGIAGWISIAPLVITAKKGSPLTLRTFFLVSVAGVVAHNLIDYNLQFVAIALPFWLMLGMMVAVPQRKKVLWFRLALVSAAGLLLFFSFYEGIHLFVSSRARRAEVHGKPYEALRWYSWIDSSLFPRDARLAQSSILLGLNQMPQAEDAVNRYLSSNAEDGRAWRLLGDIYLKWNKRNDGLRAYEKAYQFAKANDAGILRGLIYLQEDVDRALLVQRRAEFDELINDFGLAIQQNTHFIDLSSNVEELVSACDLMARYFPQDSQLYRSLGRASMEHAKSERARTASRPRGLLW